MVVASLNTQALISQVRFCPYSRSRSETRWAVFRVFNDGAPYTQLCHCEARTLKMCLSVRALMRPSFILCSSHVPTLIYLSPIIFVSSSLIPYLPNEPTHTSHEHNVHKRACVLAQQADSTYNTVI